jgi:hypothetical protein
MARKGFTLKPWHWIVFIGFVLFLFVEYNPVFSFFVLVLAVVAAYFYIKNV